MTDLQKAIKKWDKQALRLTGIKEFKLVNNMTPDKRVEELTKFMNDHKCFDSNAIELASKFITQHHQYLMSEMVEKLEGEKETPLNTLLPESEYTRTYINGWNAGLIKAQTIIKSLTPPIKSDVR